MVDTVVVDQREGPALRPFLVDGMDDDPAGLELRAGTSTEVVAVTSIRRSGPSAMRDSSDLAWARTASRAEFLPALATKPSQMRM